MSDGAMLAVDSREADELVVLLANLLEVAQQLSPGPERTAAFEQIKNFQQRTARLLARGATASPSAS